MDTRYPNIIYYLRNSSNTPNLLKLLIGIFMRNIILQRYEISLTMDLSFCFMSYFNQDLVDHVYMQTML